MGGAQPLAVDHERAASAWSPRSTARASSAGSRPATSTAWRRILDDGWRWPLAARERARPLSIGVEANAVDLLEHLVRRGIVPDVLTDQTSAHDALNGYVPHGIPYAEALAPARATTRRLHRRARMESMAAHVRAMLALQERGAVTFDYGNNLRGQAPAAGVADAFEIPRLRPAYIRPLFCEGKGPFRWAALSGDPGGPRPHRRGVLESSPRTSAARWIRLARERVALPGPAGAHLLAGLRRARQGGEGVCGVPFNVAGGTNASPPKSRRSVR